MVADWVREDIVTVQKNAVGMRAELGITDTPTVERAEGIWQVAPGGPKKVAFTRVFSGHEFTDTEVQKLLAGEKLTFPATSAAGKSYTATGALGIGEFKGRKFVGFQLEIADKPTTWSGHAFTPDQVTKLLAGEELRIETFVSARTGNTFGCTVKWDGTAKKIIPDFNSGSDEPPRTWCKVTFTQKDYAALLAGTTIQGKGFVSAKGKKFDAAITCADEGGRKKIVFAK